MGSISRGRYEENGGLVSLFQDHGEDQRELLRGKRDGEEDDEDEEDKEEESIRLSSSCSRVSS